MLSKARFGVQVDTFLSMELLERQQAHKKCVGKTSFALV